MSTARPDAPAERTLKDAFGTKPAPRALRMSRRRRLALDESPRTMNDAQGNMLVMGESFPIAGISAPRIAHDEALSMSNVTFDGALPPKVK